MKHLSKCSVLILLATSMAWAQSTDSTTVQPEHGQAANPPGTVAASGTAAIPQQPAIADSKALELIHVQKADYPLDAERNGIQGEVIVKVTVSETGDVEKAEVVSGDPALSGAAVKAAKKFKFKPFIRNGKPIQVTTKLPPFDFYFTDKVMSTNVPKETDKHAGNAAPGSDAGAGEPKRVKISAGVTNGLLIRKIQPVYPLEAKQNHIQGSVVLRAVIGKDGRIKSLTPISGPRELIPPSIGAVQQWQYKPYQLMGEPVEVDTQITVNYTLSSF